MSRDEMIDRIKSVKDPVREIKTVYAVLDELGIKYKVTKCPKCKKDLYNIALEELGLIDNAAEISDFNTNGEWVYVCKRPQSWHGYIIDQDTPTEVIEEFVKTHPVGYYKRKENNNNTNNNE